MDRFNESPYESIRDWQLAGSSRAWGKIQGFGSLEEGWLFGDGVVFGEAVLDAARVIAQEMTEHGFWTTDAFPAPGGEIAVVAYELGYYLEFTIELDMTITYTLEKDDQEIAYKEGLTPADVAATLATFKDHPCKRSDSFLESTTGMPISADFKVGPLAEARMALFHSSIRIVSSGQAPRYVNISESIIEPETRVNRSSSGSSPRTSYQVAAS